MIRCCPPRPMRWNAAIGAIARCNATSIACARKCRSVHALRWTCGGKPKPKAVNKPSPHSIMHGLDKPGVFTTVSHHVDFQNETTYFQLLGDGQAFVECVIAFLLALGFQLAHKATCKGGGCLTRHSHYVRVRLGRLTIWRIQCTTCRAVFTVLPHFVLRYRRMRPEVARDALLATHGGLSLELCAVIWHISPMALSRLVCAFGHQSLVTVLTRCGLPLPMYFLADEKHSRCLTDKDYLPTIVSGRVLWHLGYTTDASATALAQSYGEFQRAALQQEPSYRVRGILTDGFDSTTSRFGWPTNRHR